ncbi:ExeM/NucH family extracellular endonuclease [uncultured Ferrimonas sp.]|uniref:ExeM/NucH family extracellular endonuclease n=1 Tax=uncultured Ferrimonas sp. TaxID=432640 RepID=UPI00261E174D|nr:ExeM/NucH family extracellular endonuclease [uncultured Ferrimonas sp.]
MNYFAKPSALALAIMAAMPASADLLISEYVEGSSSRKAIELYNSGSEAVSLAGYSLVRYKDGATTPLTMVDLSDQTIPAGKLLVVLNNNKADTGIVLADGIPTLINGNLQHNGGDAVALIKDDQIVDVVGDIPTPDKWAANVTLRRNADALSANNKYDSTDWSELNTDDFSGLGNLDAVAAPEPLDCSQATFTTIPAIQGEGATSPLIPDGAYSSTETVFVQGVVSARGDNSFKGFYLQDIDGDGNDATSDGLFINMGAKAPAEIQPGVEVCVQGYVKEFYNLTQLDISADPRIEIGASGTAPAATPLVIGDGETLADALERVEGMKVVLDSNSDMKVTGSFGYQGKNGNVMLLSHQAPLFKPTQILQPGSDAAAAQAIANSHNRLIVQSDYKDYDGQISYLPDFDPEQNFMRIGDTLTGLEGMVGYAYNEYRLVATNTIDGSDFSRLDERPDSPAIATQGDIRVGSFNVLNLFNDTDGGDDAPMASRGAKTLEEFQLQRTKIVNAIVEMNADIIGLMEIGNNGFGEKSAIQDLVNTLNLEMTDEQMYQFIEIAAEDKYQDKFLGSDAITVALIYRAATVTPEGAAFVIATPEQHAPAAAASRGEGDDLEQSPQYDKYQRHSLGQTFMVGDKPLTVVVNHLKSKGSECLEDWQEFADDSDPLDLQGHCNEFRVSAADVIGKAISNIEGDVLVLGDMNAYGLEDPVRVLTDYDASSSDHVIVTAAHTTLNGETLDAEPRIIEQGYGLVNLNTQMHGVDTYSYVYNGELGNLDHALGNSSVAQRVVAIEDWHINAAESSQFQYADKYTSKLTKSDNLFSSSDHDPVVVALNYTEAKKDSDSGSLGHLGLMLLAWLGLRRRR